MVFSVYFINRNICFTLISALQEVISLFVWPISWCKLSCYFGGGFIHVCRYSQLLQTAPTRLRKRWIRLLLVSLEWPGNFSPVIYRLRFFTFSIIRGLEIRRKEVNSRLFNLHRDYSKSLTLPNVGELPWNWKGGRKTLFTEGGVHQLPVDR